MTHKFRIYRNGGKEEYWKNSTGDYHREDGPAFVRYYKNGNILKSEGWCINGDFYRIDGPAYIEYDMEGNVTYKEYWYYDRCITRIVKKLFGCVPNELTKDQAVLLKLSLPEECFVK